MVMDGPCFFRGPWGFFVYNEERHLYKDVGSHVSLGGSPYSGGNLS